MQNHPHIAYLYSRYPVVSQTFCDTEMMALEALGFRITIGSLNPPTTSFRHERLKNLQAEVIYPPPRPILDLPTSGACDDDPLWRAMRNLANEHDAIYGKQFKSLTRARNAWYFAQEFKKRGVKHVHIHFANRATHTALFLKLAGLTFSFTAHAQDFMVDLGSRELLQEMAREAEFVVAVSDFSKGLLQEMCPGAAEKIVRIYNGLDPASFQVTTPAPGPLKVLSVGRLIDFKGFQYLIPAVAQLHQQGVPVTLQIVGDGPLRSTLEGLIQTHQAQSYIQLLGIQSQAQIKQLLEASDVFALACIVDEKGASDILPTVITEAMAAGRPIVSTKLVGVPEMVKHGITGFLAEPENVSELTDYLKTLAENEPLRRRLGQASREKFNQTFTLQLTAEQLAERFLKLIPSSPPPKLTPVCCLLSTWPATAAAAEIQFLTTQPQVRLLAATAQSNQKVDGSEVEFLPDAMVLEAAWRSAPELVAKAESLYEKCGPIEGEVFFREARRAVYLAGQLKRWGVRHVHALRSDALLCTWLIHKLTGLTVSASIEWKPVISRTSAEIIARDFTFGSLSDPKIPLPWPNHFQLNEPAPKAGLFRKSPAPPTVDVPKIWTDWLAKLC